jgi:transcriptional regulator with XRE-family HTH domain
MSSEAVRAFGREVHRRRIALSMNLQALGADAGLTAGYLGNVESGKQARGLSLDVAFRIAKALGADIPDLVGGYKGLSPVGLEAGRLIEALPPLVKVPTLDLLRALAAAQRGRQA